MLFCIFIANAVIKSLFSIFDTDLQIVIKVETIFH